MSGTRPALIVTPKIRYYVGKALGVGSFLGLSPFRWNKALQRADMGSARQQFLWKLNMILALSHVAFVCIRCIQVNLDEDPSQKLQGIYLRFVGAFYLLGSIVHIGIIQKRNVLTSHVNSYLDYMEEFEDKFVAKHTSKSPVLILALGIVMQLAGSGSALCLTLVGSIALVRPRSHEQILSLLPDFESQYISWVSRIIGASFMGYVSFIYYASSMGMIQTNFMFTTGIHVLVELSHQTCSITREALREPEESLNVYRWYVRQVKLYNDIYGKTVLPGSKILLITLCVLCTYGAIKLQGVEALALGFVALFCFIFVVVMFTFLAQVQFRSQTLIQTWTSSGSTDPWFRRSVNSLPVISINLRGAYKVDPEMVLTMMDIIVGQTVSFLILNP